MAATALRRTGIVTPEAVVLEFETAGVASRILARIIDGIVLWLGLLAFLLAMGVLLEGSNSQTLAVVLVVLVVFFAIFGYWMLLETVWHGRTLGKAAMGLRVVTLEGAPVTFRHSAIRAIVGVVDFFVPPIGPVAVVTVGLSSNNQRLGDLAAGTIVLRERKDAGPLVALNLTEPQGRPELMASLQLARLSDAQYGVVRRYLLRVYKMDPSVRASLAERLSAAVEQVTGVRRPGDLHPEWYLHAAGLAYQRRTGRPIAFEVGTQPPPPTATTPRSGQPAPPAPPSPPAPPPPPPAGLPRR
jgi:uncharacterized RDD family membrane protein YckC